MTTITQNILPIPELIVKGTSNYTIPAGKYAEIMASGGLFNPSTSQNVPTSWWGPVDIQFGSSGAGQVRLKALEGQLISFPVTGASGNWSQNPTNSIGGNGSTQFRSIAPIYKVNNGGTKVATIQAGFLNVIWQNYVNFGYNVNYNQSVTLDAAAVIEVFPIPKNNLPDALKE